VESRLEVASVLAGIAVGSRSFVTVCIWRAESEPLIFTAGRFVEFESEKDEADHAEMRARSATYFSIFVSVFDLSIGAISDWFPFCALLTYFVLARWSA
jgi:hypothetical protein